MTSPAVSALSVFREFKGRYQLVGGFMRSSEAGFSFCYDRGYIEGQDANPIAPAFPLQVDPFSPQTTRNFFDGLLPEGQLREYFSQGLHISSDDFVSFVSRLNDESAGALIFGSDEEELSSDQRYDPIGFDVIARFATRPMHESVAINAKDRLSLAGAQAKIGLYHAGDDLADQWYLPQGSAPSTHILKAPNPAFPLITVNEALCLETARLCDIETADCDLVPINGTEPVLSVRRFDRIVDPLSAERIDGLLRPDRVHAMDFNQLLDIPSIFKYEPTDGHYARHCALLLDAHVSNPFADRMEFFLSLVFSYLIGNCDNHLKNYSLVWLPNWKSCRLSPQYDMVCTTYYGMDRTMGIGLSPSRNIDGVTGESLIATAAEMNIPTALAKNLYVELCERFPSALDKARERIIAQGFHEVEEIAGFILEDTQSRLTLFGCAD